MEEGAVGCVEVPVAGDALQLPPGLVAGRPIGAEVTASKPPVVGTIRVWAEVSARVDGTLASSSEEGYQRQSPQCLGAWIAAVLTEITQWLVDDPGEQLGVLGAFAAALFGFEECCGFMAWCIRPPHMDHEADKHEGDQ